MDVSPNEGLHLQHPVSNGLILGNRMPNGRNRCCIHASILDFCINHLFVIHLWHDLQMQICVAILILLTPGDNLAYVGGFVEYLCKYEINIKWKENLLSQLVTLG